MTAITATDQAAGTRGSRPPLVTYPLLLRFATQLGSSVSFYLLLSVVPLYARAAAGGSAPGLATGALMVTTVAGELITPRLTAACGYRLTLAAGLILLGAPSLALAGPARLDVITAVCVIRGLGFGITVVAGGSLTAALIPAERRGEGLALSGLVSGVPALTALPLGVWLAGRIGYPLVFTVAAVAALAALAAVPGLPGRASAGRPSAGRPASDPAGHQPASHATAGRPARGPAGDEPASPASAPPLGVLAALRTPTLLRPGIMFAVTTTAAGIVVTFLPIADHRATGGLTALALFAQAASATLGRCLSGRYSDRHGPVRLIIPALATASSGMLMLTATGTPAAVLAGCVLFGTGFGVAQNTTLSLMFSRVPASGYAAVSAVWNIAYDAGMGLGAAAFGLLASGTGYPAAFAITSAVMLAALAPALRDRRLAAS
jgi:predicted MFS family arabinose efflux permease